MAATAEAARHRVVAAAAALRGERNAMESSSLWGVLGQASNVAQLVGVDALGLVSMAALAARRHRDACRRLGQHVELVGGLLRELELAELMRREATRRPLEQLQGALRRCYALVTACQEDRGYLHRLLLGARMANELRAAQHEIDMYIRLIPLIALVDNSSSNRRVTATEGVRAVVPSCSDHHTRFQRRALEFIELHVQGAAKPSEIGGKSLVVTVDPQPQEEKIMDIEAVLKLFVHTEENYPGFRKFDFIQIVDATDGFSEKRILGKGGFGTVYKGHLLDGLTVAIKTFDADTAIFDLKRLAEGLLYLHKHCWIVHRDLKPSNILLDHDMNPKIGDFGSAVTLVSDVAEERTKRVVGTSGYIAPEYASQGLYSLKTDVFSFGVVVLETISGRKNFIMEKQRDIVGYLVRDAWHMWKDGRLQELVDPALCDGYESTVIMRCTQVALLCAQEDPADRPTMTDVTAMLNSESIMLSDPKEPTELTHGGASPDRSSTYIGHSSKAIDITITSSAPVSTRVRIIVEPEI
uniref:Protein kinase domain-containing protein n=1 Tax=Oryza glumipatula TaxID=40148 RepID=A0A0E0ADK6_9ORYZ